MKWVLVACVVATSSICSACHYQPTDEAPRAGQIVFLAVPEAEAVPPAPLSSGRLTIQSCTPVGSGIRVVGHVRPLAPQTFVLVTGGERDSSGTRIGVSDLIDRGYPGARPGDFSVDIPWASATSRFAATDDPGPGGAGAWAKCP